MFNLALRPGRKQAVWQPGRSPMRGWSQSFCFTRFFPCISLLKGNFAQLLVTVDHTTNRVEPLAPWPKTKTRLSSLKRPFSQHRNTLFSFRASSAVPPSCLAWKNVSNVVIPAVADEESSLLVSCPLQVTLGLEAVQRSKIPSATRQRATNEGSHQKLGHDFRRLCANQNTDPTFWEQIRSFIH